MLQILNLVATFMCILTIAFADVAHILDHHHVEISTTTPQPPPHPYVFSYSAGRTYDTIDRMHTEVSDGSGVVRGKFAYVDPKNEVRTVQYIADANGFHPQLSHAVVDTAANQRATADHLRLFNEIAAAHAQQQAHPENIQYHAAVVETANPVQDTVAVQHAKNKHYTLFDKIAHEHAQIGAEREQERLAFEATSEHYDDKHRY